ncbi:MAG: dihydroorotate dehydrogenase [candidate division KSB1 bacterium]|nr:dihydroorotate dehydrogenase [candidate division KSB1 bacterium]
MIDTRVQIGPLELRNPVLTASGTFGYAREFEGLVDFSRLGGVVTKTVTLEPRVGNPPPRIVETPAGMLNSIGLANDGVERFAKEKLPYLAALDTRVIVNVAGKTEDEFVAVVERLEEEQGFDAFELNFSCPNVKEGGLAFSTSPSVTRRLTEAVRKVTRRCLIVKLSPNVTDIAGIAVAAEEGGADAISAINTVVGMVVDVRSRRPVLGTITGGLSGPAIRPIALARVWQIVQRVKIPVIGIGGIFEAEDALQFLIAGATAVQVGTANFVRPDAAVRVAEGIEAYCREQGLRSVREIIGSLKIDEDRP